MSSKIVGVFEVRKLFFTQKQKYYMLCDDVYNLNFKEGYPYALVLIINDCHS